MSDTSQGPGWWQASDGKWYPPEQVPAAAPPPPPPGYGPPPQPGQMPYGGAPSYGPPPQQMGGPMMGYEAQVRSGMHGCLKAFLIVLVIFVVLSIAAGVAVVFFLDDAVEDLATGDTDERNDVDDVDCDTDESGNLHATISVTNDSSERSAYIITVAWEDSSGDQLDTAIVSINAVQPGQRAEGEARTTTDAPENFDCDVATVQRFSEESGD